MNQIFKMETRKLIVIFIALIFLMGCKTSEPIYVPIHDSTEIELSELITDTSTWTDPDSLLYWFRLRCDSNYNVLLESYNSLNTGIKSKVEIKEVIKWKTDKTKVKQLEVNISMYVDSLEVQNRTIERLRKEKTITNVPYPVPGPEVRYTSKFAKICIYGFISCVILLIAWLYFKFKGGWLKTLIK